MEGVMLRDANSGMVAVANRVSDGSIKITKKPFVSVTKKYKAFSLPLIRGVVSFVESLIVGMKTLLDSAEVVGGDVAQEYQPSKFEKFLAEKLKLKVEDVAVAVGAVLGIGLALLLFTFLPTAVAGLFKGFVKAAWVLSLVEGVVKLGIFVAYILIVSLQKDVKRVFQYHGAEHKTINCYEADEEVTVENVRRYSRIHMRCGTSFMFYVMVVSIVLFSFITWSNVAVRVLLKVLLMPVVAGISYEIIRFSGKSKNKVIRSLAVPGTLLQKITTAEPDDSQIEVGIASLMALIGKKDDEADCQKENNEDTSAEE